jgi:predicted transcriptional regulator
MAKILLRIDDEFKKEIEVLAKRNKRSVNSEILMAIYDYVKNNEVKEEIK